MDDEWRAQQQEERERQAAQEILDDPDSDQLSRDIAHLRLQHEECRKGYLSSDEGLKTISEDVPKEWLIVEAYELGQEQMRLTDEAVVALAEDPLLRDKCKTIRSGLLADGTPSVCRAYPKLMEALENQLGSSNPQKMASANAVMACMLRATDPAGSLPYFHKAIRIRPDDWRLRSAVASSYMSVGKTSMSLEALSQAVKLTPENSFDRFQVESCRGKVLMNLGRCKEAKASFLKVLVDAERFKENSKLSPLDQAHLVVAEYMLCLIWADEKNEKMLTHQWKSAEAKRQALDPEIRQRINWDARLQTQSIIAVILPYLLTHQECHFCHQFCLNRKLCSGCQVTLYCSRECQVAHWKTGHKKQCKGAKQTRKTQKKERMATYQKSEAASSLPPLDATLDPWALWAKAIKLSKDTDKAQDAVFYFSLALFLDFSLDAHDMGTARTAIDSCDPNHPLTLALKMVTHSRGARNPIRYIETNHRMAATYLESREIVPVQDNTSQTVEQVERSQFGLALCMIFRARFMGRYFSVISQEQAQSDVYKEAYDIILELINGVKLYLSTQRWLTVQFELGYSNIDIGAADEAKRWLEMFVQNLATVERTNNGKLTKHWKKMRKTALTKLQMIPLLQMGQRVGIVP